MQHLCDNSNVLEESLYVRDSSLIKKLHPNVSTQPNALSTQETLEVGQIVQFCIAMQENVVLSLFKKHPTSSEYGGSLTHLV